MSKDAKMNGWLQKTMAKAKKNGVVNDSGASNAKEKEPRDILPKPKGYDGKRRMKFRDNTFTEFIEVCPIVGQWVRFKKTLGAKRVFVYPFLHFCREANIMPKDFGDLNTTRKDTLKARDMVWDVCSKLMNENRNNTALAVRKSCKAFYHFYCKGDADLPFDTKAGGFHHISVDAHKLPEFEWGIFEEAKEHFFDMLSKARGLMMRTIMLLIYVTGWRINVFTHLKWKHLEEIGVIDVDGQDVLIVKITPEIDTKQGRALKKYYSFITGTALETLRLYEERFRNGRDSEQYVFLTPQSNRPIMRLRLEQYFKRIVRECEREGLLKEGSSKHGVLTPHKLRKVFRKVMQETKGIEFEYKEFLMGHKLPGGATDIYALKDYRELARAYLKADFSAPKDYYKRKWLEEQRAREKMETATQIYKEPAPEGLPVEEAETPITQEAPMEQAIIKKAIVSRIPKPAPNYCPRGLTFHNTTTDSYCHTLCAKTHPTEYQACQELQVEQPEMFAEKKTSAKH